MKRAIKIYIKIANKFVDIICKLFNKKESLCKLLNSKFVRKIFPWFLILVTFAFLGFVIYVGCIFKSKKIIYNFDNLSGVHLNT